MADIDTMTTRERTVALMRGSREKMQLGYTAPNAAYAALRYERGFGADTSIDDPELTGDLFPYAEGFADGMADAMEGFPRAQPTAAMLMDEQTLAEITGPYKRLADGPHHEHTEAYEEGRELGRQEFAPGLYPALERKPDPDYIQRFPTPAGTGTVTRAEPGWANATDAELQAEAERRAKEG
jgi:hypothetical protein